MRIRIKGWLLVYFLENGFWFLSCDCFRVSDELILVLVHIADTFFKRRYEIRPDTLELARQEVAILILSKYH